MKRQLAIVLTALALVVGTVAGSSAATSPFSIFDGSNLNQIFKRNKLIVGMESAFFPFEYANE